MRGAYLRYMADIICRGFTRIRDDDGGAALIEYTVLLRSRGLISAWPWVNPTAMPLFVHLAPESSIARIRRAGISRLGTKTRDVYDFRNITAPPDGLLARR